LIISERYGFAFVHIPKCAGTTVREQLQDLDETEGAFAAVREHSVLGRIDYMHLPLRVLAEHFPDTFSTLDRLDGFAVTRDPMSRFRSSVAEYLKRVKRSRLAELSAAELQAVIRDIIRQLEDRPRVLTYEIAHFIPQNDYIRLDGRKVVEHTVALERIADLFSEIARRTGRPIDTNAWSNQDFVLRFEGLKGAVWRANDIARGLLPYRSYQGLKRLTRPFLVKERASPAAEQVFGAPEIVRFVEKYYADDFRQHAADLRKGAVEQATPVLRAQTADG
jgi:hypothetical protein